MRGSGRLTAKIREIGSRPGGQLDKDSRLMRTMREVDEHLGIQSRLDCASTDANIPLSKNIPALVLGISTGGGAHTKDESLNTAPIEKGMEQLVRFVELVIGDR